MADKSLEILIRTRAELAGAQQAAKALEVAIGKAKALGQNYAAQEAQLQKANAAIAAYTTGQNNAGNAAEDSGKKIDLLNLKHSELRKITTELIRAFPELGRVMQLALDPRILGITLLIYSFRILNTQIQNLMSLLAPSEWQGRVAAIQSGKQAIDDAKIAAGEFANELHRAGNETQDIADKTQNVIDELHRQGVAQAELRNSQKALQLEQVNMAEKSGQISPAQAIIQRAAINEKFARADEQAKEIEENKILNAGLQERSQLLERISQLEAELPDKESAAADAKGRLAELDKEREIYATNIASSNAKIAQYEEEMEKRSKFGLRSGTFDTLTDDDVKKALQSERDARDKAKNFLDKLNANRVPQSIQDNSTIANAAGTEDELRSARGKLGELDKTLPIQTQTYLGNLRNSRAVALNQSQTLSIQTMGQLIDLRNTDVSQVNTLQEKMIETLQKTGRISPSLEQTLDKILAEIMRIDQFIKNTDKKLSSRIQNSYLR